MVVGIDPNEHHCAVFEDPVDCNIGFYTLRSDKKKIPTPAVAHESHVASDGVPAYRGGTFDVQYGNSQTIPKFTSC